MTLVLANSREERRLTQRRLAGDWLRVAVLLHEPGPARLSRLNNLRVLLVADVLRRVVEDLHGGQVLLVFVLPDAVVSDPADALWPILPLRSDAFGIRPPTGIADSLDAAAEVLGAPTDVMVAGPNGRTMAPLPSQFILPVELITTPDPSVDGRDPLALRLALLCHRHDEALSLAPTQLEETDEMLRQWRGRVAEWAEQPSAPIPRAIIGQARTALDANLDVPNVIKLLHEVMEDLAVSPGAKFETFVFFDRVLALDLARALEHRFDRG